MPAKRKYQIPDREKYQRHREHVLQMMAISRNAFEKGPNHWNLSSLLGQNLELAGLALAFEDDDAEVRAHFDEALTAARMWFDTGRPWQPRPQPVDPKVTIVPTTNFTFEVTERLPPMAEIGWIEDWQIDAFSTALSTFLAFGTRDEVTRAAETPEVAYRSPRVVADPAQFARVRADKAWGRGQHDEVRAACHDVLECPKPTGMPARWATSFVKSREPLRAHVRALLALVDRRPDAFAAAMDDLAAAHKAQMTRERSGFRFYSLMGLSLARIAKSQGIDVPDTPMIPTRFLSDIPPLQAQR